MTRSRAQPAFTLLEVTLAATLALVLLVAMLTFYQQSAEVRAAVTEEADRLTAERAVMGLMTRELRAAFVYRYLGQGMDGAVGSATFTTVAVPSGSAWVPRKATEDAAIEPERDVRLVSYRLRIIEDEQGEPYVEGIERTCQRTLTAQVAEEGEGQEIETTLLTPYFKFLRLGYWDGSAWAESWSGDDLPQAVEIVLGAEPLPERVEPAEYPYPTFRRVVFVPSAGQGTEGTIIRGLGRGGGP